MTERQSEHCVVISVILLFHNVLNLSLYNASWCFAPSGTYASRSNPDLCIPPGFIRGSEDSCLVSDSEEYRQYAKLSCRNLHVNQ
jgi:hypothetical protein